MIDTQASQDTPGAASAAPTSLPLLTKAAVFGAKDIQTDYVDVPEWGGRMKVKGLTADEWDDIENTMVVVQGEKQSVNYAHFRARVTAKGCINEDGTPFFDAGDVVALGAKSSAPLARLSARIIALSKVANKDVEALVGNSSGGRSAASSTT